MKPTIFLILLLIPLVTAVIPIDVGICNSQDADTEIQTCINTCTIESQAYVQIYNAKKAELDGIVDSPIQNCEGYPECVAFCKTQPVEANEDEFDLGPMLGAIGSCLYATCPGAIATCASFFCLDCSNCIRNCSCFFAFLRFATT